MTPEDYGDKYSDHFLEQYKLYVEMADRISQRREQSNRFYVTLVSAVVALLIVVSRIGTPMGAWPIVLLVSGIFGAALSSVWYFNIRSYRTLNSAKFTVINQMESQLPTSGYSDEWELLRPKGTRPQYFQLTRVEQFVPVIFLLLFVALIIYSLVTLTG